MVGETVDAKTVALLLLSYVLLQLELGAITFGISACIKRNGIGIGLGLALWFYFINIIDNLTEEAEHIRYITPFGYTDSAHIINERSLEWQGLLVGAALALIGIVVANRVYTKKDIA